MHVNSVPLRRDVIVPTLIRRNVKSVDDVQLHVLTMQSHLKVCKFACPVNAITYNEYGISVIDDLSGNALIIAFVR